MASSIKERLERGSAKRANGCVEWLGWTVDGYGRIRDGKKRVATHRASYELFFGEIPNGMCVCHVCDNRKCIAPNHLFLGTRADNNRDKVNKNRQAKGERHGLCGEDHPLSTLSKEQVTEIRNLTGSEPQRMLAKRFGVSQSSISFIQNRKRWKST